MKIVVYTALFGAKDQLWSVPQIVQSGAEYVAFVDSRKDEVGLWTSGGVYGRCASVLSGSGRMPATQRVWHQRIVGIEDSPRRTARYYKVMSHEVFPDADVTIWVDANIRLLVKVSEAVKWLAGKHLAAFRHPDRVCVYQEVDACLRFGKGDRSKLARQKAEYLGKEMPRGFGLASTRSVIRDNSGDVARLNTAWWEQICRFSERDQVSLPFVCWKLGLEWAEIPCSAEQGQFFWFIPHGKMP